MGQRRRGGHLQTKLNRGRARERHHQNYRLPSPLNVGNTFPRLLNSIVEQKEDTGGQTYTVQCYFPCTGKKGRFEMSAGVSSSPRFA
ncbi:hypothetical protein AV530_020096 [Patagioenas fasciata monilis]|uniref:Uncharacterized protein n=1 Tax=Patagioenas fasciata monilis TaxID=372326 RepID=A0A1V4JI34_PATFA|nr:hypothetical protein AV530_020096 [Patagioenas fasciata monilis]